MWLGEPGVAETVAPAAARASIVAGTGEIATGRSTTREGMAKLVVLRASPRTSCIAGANDLIDSGLIFTT